MKRILYGILAVLILIVSGCSSNTVQQTEPTLTTEPSASIQTDTPSATPTATPQPKYPTIENNQAEEPNTFSLGVTLNDAEHKLIVTQNLIYHNNTGTELDEIYFNLIPQAFQKDGGGIDMQDIFISDQKCSMEQVKETVYKIALPSSLGKTEQIDIAMEYEVKIPNIQNRFGYQENVFNLGNFIVTPAVYGADGWVIEPYVDIGDAFYTDIANYDVTIQVPEGYIVAATGEEVSQGSYHAANVRDFAFCASDSYETISDIWEDVAITVYYGDHMTQTAQRVIDCAKKSLELYSEKFGKYPYTTLRIVMSGLTGGVNGMEYPTLIMISPEIALESLSDVFGVDPSDSSTVEAYMVPLDTSVCHEIAHQWFYGVVGNDQISEPWLDEGLCRYAEYLYQKAYPPQISEDSGVYLMADRLRDRYIMVSGEGGEEGMGYAPDTTDLNLSLYDWINDNPMDYSEIYDKGASLIYEMEQQMGEDAFDQAMQEYVQHFAYRFVTKDTFQEFWSSKADFSKLFALYLS